MIKTKIVRYTKINKLYSSLYICFIAIKTKFEMSDNNENIKTGPDSLTCYNTENKIKKCFEINKRIFKIFLNGW
jgi:hypothetical protein